MDPSQSTSQVQMDQELEETKLIDFLNDLDDIVDIKQDKFQKLTGHKSMIEINEEFGLYIPGDDLSDIVCIPDHMENKQPEEKPGDEENNANKGLKEESASSIKSIQTEKGRKKKCNNGHQKQVKACTHCGTQKTPFWRSGPMGFKTLCNACGVRYNCGGLYPEYRPAASPTFSADKHSNSHKVVLEMRRNKEAFH